MKSDVCLCACLVLVCGILVCIRRHRPSRYHDGIIFPDDDVRENIIHYDEEGVGEREFLPYHQSSLYLPVPGCLFLGTVEVYRSCNGVESIWVNYLLLSPT